MDSLKGSFLIASPGLMDPNFVRTVVFMVEHNEEGAFGLVITRPTNINLWSLGRKIYDEMDAFPDSESLKKIPVYAGGPVQTSAVFFLHTASFPGKEPVNPGVSLGSEAEELRVLLKDQGGESPPRFRAFLGYSGWGAGQLEKEMKAGGWLVRPATLEDVFDVPPAALWSKLIKSFGGDLAILGSMPINPEFN